MRRLLDPLDTLCRSWKKGLQYETPGPSAGVWWSDLHFIKKALAFVRCRAWGVKIQGGDPSGVCNNGQRRKSVTQKEGGSRSGVSLNLSFLICKWD